MAGRTRLDTPAQAGRPATVIACEGREASLECGGDLIAARLALGCLVQPEPGDTVLVLQAGQANWITLVLDRSGSAPVRLATAGDMVLAAGGSLALDAGTRLQLTAPELDVQAGTVRTLFDHLTHIGQHVVAHVPRLRLVIDMMETIAEHVLLRTRRSSRFVAETDQCRSGSIDFRAETSMHLHARAAFVSAQDLVRVDADQIHMG